MTVDFFNLPDSNPFGTMTPEMTVYNTNVSRHYAVTAGFNSTWSGVREILQNALDGHDKGHKMSVDYGKARDRSGESALKVSNEGVSLSRNALVLGFSTKTDDAGQRGKHGEGLVVGINALLNLGHKVWIRTGNEVWIPKHVKNQEGLEVLVIEIKKQQNYSNDFIVEIKGIEEKEWETFKERILPFQEDLRTIPGSCGQVLLDKKFKSSLFVKGVYVGKMPDPCFWGYNLDVHLNRDREVADPYQLRNAMRSVIVEGVENNLFSTKDILNLLNNEETGEAQAFAQAFFWGSPTKFHDQITEEFYLTNGEDAIPVGSIGEAQEAEHFGFRGVVVSKAVQKIIEHKTGSFKDRINQRSLTTERKYSWSDLDQEEKENLTTVVNLVAEVEKDISLNKINIVDFIGETVYGTACVVRHGGELELVNVNISKKVLKDRAELIDTLVHEVAHKYAGDGDNLHEREQRRIMSTIIANNLM